MLLIFCTSVSLLLCQKHISVRLIVLSGTSLSLTLYRGQHPDTLSPIGVRGFFFFKIKDILYGFKEKEHLKEAKEMMTFAHDSFKPENRYLSGSIVYLMLIVAVNIMAQHIQCHIDFPDIFEIN